MEAPNTTPGSGQQVPPPAPAPMRSATPLPPRILISIGVAILLIVAVLLAFFHPGIRSWISSLFGVSLENRTVMVEGAGDAGATFYTLRGDTFEPVALPAGLTAYSDRAGVKAGVLGASDIVTVTDTETTPVYSDGEFKDAVAVSPDGMSVAFASLVPGETEPGVGSWYVKTVNLSDKRVDIVGVGYAPHYFLRDGKTYLLYTAPNGITVFDASAGTAVTTPIAVGDSLEYTVTVSDDGSFLAIREALSGQYYIYSVSSVVDKLVFSSLRGLPPEVASVSFGGGKLYAVSKTDAGQELLVYASADAAEPTERHLLPESGATYTILP